MRRVMAALAAVLVTALTATIVSVPTPASATWYCGDTCNRTDPSSFQVSPYQVCADDAVTVDSVYNADHGLTLQLRYSSYCRTVWGRIYGGRNQNYYISLQRVYADGYTETLYATREIPRTRPYSWGYQWNNAILFIRACVSTDWDDSSPWLIMCTTSF